MELELITSQVVGLSNDYKWSETMVEGNFIATIEIIGDGITSAKEESGVFLTSVLELVNRHKPQEKEAFKRIVGQYIENSPIKARISSLVVGFKTGTTLFLYSYGKGSAILKRGESWSPIISGEGLSTGTILENDLLILTTQSFEKLMPHEMMIRRFATQKDPQTAGEQIGALLHNFDDSKGAAAVFTVFKKPDRETNSTELESLDKKTDMETDTNQNISTPISMQVEEVGEVMNKEAVMQNKEAPSESLQNSNKPVQSVIEEPSLGVHSNIQMPVVENPLIHKPQKTGFFSRVQGLLPNKETIAEKTKLPLNTPSVATVVASPRKRILVIALLLIGILGASFFVSGGGKSISSNANINTELENISHKVEEGEALADLNALRSKTALKEAESKLVPLIETLKKGSKERIEAEQLLVRTRNTLGIVSKSYTVTPSVFADLSVVKPGAVGSNMAIYEGEIAVLDRINSSIMTVDDNGSVTIVGGGGDAPSPNLVSIHGSNVFTLASSGLVRVETGSKQQKVIVEDVSVISNAVDMVAYAGNIYILDSGSKKIWKIAPSGSGYTRPQPYLSENETIPLSVLRMAIDGSVWVLGENRVKKYVRGAEEFITFEGLDDPLINASDIFIDDISNYIYLYDSGSSRVVIFDTDGVYHSQYVLQGIGGVSEIVVSEGQGRLFLLSGSTIYEVNLHTEDFVQSEEE